MQNEKSGLPHFPPNVGNVFLLNSNYIGNEKPNISNFFLFASHFWGIRNDDSHWFPNETKTFALNFHSMLKEKN